MEDLAKRDFGDVASSDALWRIKRTGETVLRELAEILCSENAEGFALQDIAISEGGECRSSFEETSRLQPPRRKRRLNIGDAAKVER